MMDSREVSPKSATIALLLCIFFGMFGIHRFYVGKIGTGILMLITLGGLGFWVLYDLVTISCCEFRDCEGRELEFAKGRHKPLKVFFALLGMLLAYFIVIFALSFSLAIYATRGLTNLVEAQLSAIKQDNIEQAYDYTSQEFKDKTSLEQFKEFVKQSPILKDYTSISYLQRDMNNNAGIVAIKLSGPDGDRYIRYLLIYRDDSWKIVGMSMSQDQEGSSE